MTDFVVINHGSVWTIWARSPDAKAFAAENFKIEGWQGEPDSFTTDWRPARDLCLLLQDEGWDVRDGGSHY
jgi:hypothetical protein